MIVWAKELRCSKQTEKSKQKLMRAIESGKCLPSLYCIALPENKQNVLEIIPVRGLGFPHFERSEIKVIGLAKGKDDAEELVRTMVEEVYRMTGDFSMEYFFD